MEYVVHRTIDKLGRLQLPAEVRRAMFGDHPQAGHDLEVELDVVDGVLHAKPVECVLHPAKPRRSST